MADAVYTQPYLSAQYRLAHHYLEKMRQLNALYVRGHEKVLNGLTLPPDELAAAQERGRSLDVKRVNEE